jgi:ABC-type transport system involved in cytochrome bd biosynthesis fused ATPase/permease subunit
MLYDIYILIKPYLTFKFVFFIILNYIIISLLDTSLLICISEGYHNYILYYLIIKILSPIISNFIVKPNIRKLAFDVKHDFNLISFENFNSMSFESKLNKQSTIFWDNLQLANNSIYLLINWGLYTVMNLISILLSIILIFVNKNLIIELIITFLCFIVFYYLFIQQKQNIYMTLDKYSKNTIQSIKTKIQLDMIAFQYGEYTIDHMTSQIKQIDIINNNLDLECDYISTYTSTSNQLLSTILCYFVSNNISNFILIILTMNQLIMMINNLISFLIQYNKIKNEYSLLNDFWTGVHFEDQPEKMYPVKNLEIININIINRIRLHQSCGPISLAPGEKIYIKGSTGCGKSTFIKALIGKIDGSEANIGKMKNYYHYVSDYYQEIKEKIPSSKISIRTYFKGANDECINKYLLRVFKQEELEKIKNILTYDMDINEKISGGEKSRLLLTRIGFDADINNKGIIVLDEPCPDIDYDTYIDIINLFFENYKHCTIIMAAHLCECKKKNLNIKWTQQFDVIDGVIYRF